MHSECLRAYVHRVSKGSCIASVLRAHVQRASKGSCTASRSLTWAVVCSMASSWLHTHPVPHALPQYHTPRREKGYRVGVGG
eukprot:2979597-Rhodomonas_salina.1